MGYHSGFVVKMRILGLLFLAAILFGSRCATTTPSARKSGAPITIFDIGQRIPRNSRVLELFHSVGGSSGFLEEGMAAIGPWGSDSSYGSCRNKKNALRGIKKRARVAGAGAISILHAERDRDTGCYGIWALLMDMVDIDGWPRIGLTEDEIRYLFYERKNELDEIEGIWECSARTETDMSEITRAGREPHPFFIQAFKQRVPEEMIAYRVAIVKAAGDPYYPYAVYILDPEIPEWQAGFLKARLRKLPDFSGYAARWYRSTFHDDLREFRPNNTGGLKASAVLTELGVKYSVELILTRVYPLQR